MLPLLVGWLGAARAIDGAFADKVAGDVELDRFHVAPLHCVQKTLASLSRIVRVGGSPGRDALDAILAGQSQDDRDAVAIGRAGQGKLLIGQADPLGPATRERLPCPGDGGGFVVSDHSRAQLPQAEIP